MDFPKLLRSLKRPAPVIFLDLLYDENEPLQIHLIHATRAENKTIGWKIAFQVLRFWLAKNTDAGAGAMQLYREFSVHCHDF